MRRTKYTKGQVRRLRKMLTDDPNLSIAVAGARVGIHCKATAGSIYRNVYKWCYDPDYVPVPRKGSEKARQASARSRRERCTGPRKPATEYTYHCKTCGMGYESLGAAKVCCDLRGN